jgi:hypothetical protein
MKTMITIIAVTLALGGCVSQANQKSLNNAQAGCNAGDQDACTAAGYQAQANAQEQQTNAAVVTGIGAAILGGAIAGAEISNANRPFYVAPAPFHYWH